MNHRLFYFPALPVLVFLSLFPLCLFSAHADSFTSVSYNQLHSGMKVRLDGVTRRIATVEFSVDLQQAETELSEIQSWCVDPWQPAALGRTLDVPVELVSPDMVPGGMEAAWLAANADTYLSGQESDSLKTAALQLAIWEVIVEKDGVFDLNSGNFQVLNGRGALDLSANYLEALATDFADADQDWLRTHFAMAKSDKYQDFILAGVNANPAATPEPGTLFLMGAGMLAAGLVFRRKAGAGPGLVRQEARFRRP